jgi:hypothetical protein
LGDGWGGPACPVWESERAEGGSGGGKCRENEKIYKMRCGKTKFLAVRGRRIQSSFSKGEISLSLLHKGKFKIGSWYD